MLYLRLDIYSLSYDTSVDYLSIEATLGHFALTMMSMAQQPFTHPGAMPGHTGMAHGGQPMGHGHPSNQGIPGGGQPGVTMGQPLHPGMAGPGGPPVSQAGPIMAGMMPPGSGGPTAQAMAHLNPVVQSQTFMNAQQQMRKSLFFLTYGACSSLRSRAFESDVKLHSSYQRLQGAYF